LIFFTFETSLGMSEYLYLHYKSHIRVSKLRKTQTQSKQKNPSI